MNKLEKIKNGFYIKEYGRIDIYNYGEYRMGLTHEEIEEYIIARSNSLNVKKLVKKFYDIAGCNTCASTPDEKMLMYRHDVERFADKLFDNVDTYFD